MIQVSELRLGNQILYKSQGRIQRVKCSYPHFELISKEGAKDIYPVMLSEKIFLEAGFIENESYPLRPGAREFVLALAVQGSQINELRGYQKSNQECFARALVNGLPASQNVFQLHQLQNLHYFLTGVELLIS